MAPVMLSLIVASTWAAHSLPLPCSSYACLFAFTVFLHCRQVSVVACAFARVFWGLPSHTHRCSGTRAASARMEPCPGSFQRHEGPANHFEVLLVILEFGLVNEIYQRSARHLKEVGSETAAEYKNTANSSLIVHPLIFKHLLF